MPKSSNQCCTGRACIPFLTSLTVPCSPQHTARSKEFISVKPSAGSNTSCFHLKYPTPHHDDPNFIPSMFFTPVHPILPWQVLRVDLAVACGKPCRSSLRSLERSRTALCLPSKGTWQRDAHPLLLHNAWIPSCVCVR